MTSIAQDTDRGLLKRIAAWWQSWNPGSLSAQVGRAEAAKIAADVGLTVADLENIYSAGDGKADPMRARLVSVGLKEADIRDREPAVMRDLQRVCALCSDKVHCRHELDHEPKGKAWQSYCPNMPTFDALREERGVPKN